MQSLLQFSNGLLLVQAGNGIVTNGNSYANTLTGLLPTNKIKTVFPTNNPLADQLLTVANVMSVQSQLGLSRQVFFCQLDGFDTHSAQVETQTPLLQQLSQAVSAFYTAISQELNIAANVTTFTASEFGRTLSPSGSDGSDHAWGNHHFIIGGGVVGGKIYGNYPSLGLGGPNIIDNDLKEIGSFVRLTTLELSGSKVTDAGLSELIQLSNLTTLGLGGSNITDAGLRTMRGLTSLKELRLFQTRVTSAGVAELKRALPGLTVVK